MKNTYIPLDIIFLDHNNKIIKIARNAEPQNLQTITSEAPAQYVLEINAGLADQWNLQEGDSLIVSKNKIRNISFQKGQNKKGFKNDIFEALYFFTSEEK